MAKTEESIQLLATKLVNNYQFNRKISNIELNDNVIPNHKIVFVIGAGASNATSGLPLGKDLAKDLIHKLNCTKDPGKKKFDDWLNFMVSEHRFDKDDFKTILFSLNQIDSETLVDYVQTALQTKHTKTFSYGFFADLLYFVFQIFLISI